MSRTSLDLHLLSAPGEHDSLDWVVEAVRPYVQDKPGARIAFLPLASLYADKLIEQTQELFDGLAQVEAVHTETMDLAQMESVLRRAAVAYIPGGNTFLLNHRLHVSRLFASLRKKLETGLPLVAFSAGTVLCGPNILTSNDLNMVPTPHFDGLNLAPFNFNVHYEDNLRRDNRLIDYQVFHDNPLILMEDSAYVTVQGRTVTLVRGEAWIWRAGCEKEKLMAGREVIAHPEVKHG